MKLPSDGINSPETQKMLAGGTETAPANPTAKSEAMARTRWSVLPKTWKGYAAWAAAGAFAIWVGSNWDDWMNGPEPGSPEAHQKHFESQGEALIEEGATRVNGIEDLRNPKEFIELLKARIGTFNPGLTDAERERIALQIIEDNKYTEPNGTTYQLWQRSVAEGSGPKLVKMPVETPPSSTKVDTEGVWTKDGARLDDGLGRSDAPPPPPLPENIRPGEADLSAVAPDREAGVAVELPDDLREQYAAYERATGLSEEQFMTVMESLKEIYETEAALRADAALLRNTSMLDILKLPVLEGSEQGEAIKRMQEFVKANGDLLPPATSLEDVEHYVKRVGLLSR